ncbi:hypothetical protein [Furfurilactobacillus curtus]|uniref:Nuclear transport factor 2 family protein n=1 Tax=Furfurilactobacillus curtus TaxID=1746200 RepID=A0ABQ5JMI6_9LACO
MMFDTKKIHAQNKLNHVMVHKTVKHYFDSLNQPVHANFVTDFFCEESYIRFEHQERAGRAAILELLQSNQLNRIQSLTDLSIDIPSLDLVALVHGHVMIETENHLTEPYTFTMTLVSDRLVCDRYNNQWLIHRLNYQPM